MSEPQHFEQKTWTGSGLGPDGKPVSPPIVVHAYMARGPVQLPTSICTACDLGPDGEPVSPIIEFTFKMSEGPGDFGS
jgi:hypothetical protein